MAATSARCAGKPGSACACRAAVVSALDLGGCIKALRRAPGACTFAIQPAAGSAGPTHKNGMKVHIMTALRLLASVVRDWPLADAVVYVPVTEQLVEA